jgi:hypothetical protein
MKRRAHPYLLLALIAVALIVAADCAQVYAEAQKAQPAKENKVVKFFKDIINWPLSITKKSSEAVGKTTKRAVMTGTTTGSSAVETVTGKPAKLKDVVVEPVKGSAETAYTAVTENVKAPVEGTKEVFKPEEKK